MTDESLKRLLEGLFTDEPTETTAKPTSVATSHDTHALDKLRAGFRIVARLAHAACSNFDLGELLPQAVEIVRKESDYYYVGVFLLDRSHKWAVLQAGTGEAGRQMVEQRHRLEISGNSTVGWCIANAQVRAASDVREKGFHLANALLPDTRSELALPLLSRGRVIGAMTIHATEPDAFSEEDFTILQTVADQLANAIETTHRFEEIQASQKQVQRLAEMLSKIIDASPGWIFVKDRQHRFRMVNRSYAEAFGLQPEDFVGKDDLEMGWPEELVKGNAANGIRGIWTDDQEILDNNQPRFESQEWVQVGDERRMFATTKVPLHDTSGAVWGLAGFARDVTEQLQLEGMQSARVKELDCLNDIGRRTEENPPVPEFLDWVSDRVPSAMQHPDFCKVAIELEGQVHGTAEAASMANQMVATLRVGGEAIGKIYIAYREERGFLEAESALLGEIARRLSSYIESQRLADLAQHRTVWLQTAADVSRAAGTILDPDTLAQQVVELIRDRFGLYYAGLFLVDTQGNGSGEPGHWAVLRVGTGEAGRQMVEQGHKLEIGGQSMIGQCLASLQPCVAMDVGEEAVRFDNPMLPDTRTELALPLISRGRSLGALTIQSSIPAAFSEEDISILRNMADHLAGTIDNANLIAQAQARAHREQVLREITARVRGFTDPDTVVRTAVRELGTALGRPTFIRLGSVEELSQPPATQQGEERQR